MTTYIGGKFDFFNKIIHNFEHPHPLFFREFFFDGLTISCAEGRETHAILDLGRRIEQRRPYYFLCRREGNTRDTRSRPARRAADAVR